MIRVGGSGMTEGKEDRVSQSNFFFHFPLSTMLFSIENMKKVDGCRDLTRKEENTEKTKISQIQKKKKRKNMLVTRKK